MIGFLTNVSAQLTVSALIAIALATACGVFIGAVYYRVAGQAWRRAASIAGDDPRAEKTLGAMVVATAGNTVLALALYGVTWHASFGEMTLRASLIAALLAWFGFISSTMAVNHRFEARPFGLTVINAGHWFLVALAQGVVIGLVA